jgi:hypothetical protein
MEINTGRYMLFFSNYFVFLEYYFGSRICIYCAKIAGLVLLNASVGYMGDFGSDLTLVLGSIPGSPTFLIENTRAICAKSHVWRSPVESGEIHWTKLDPSPVDSGL